jgi:hypothetical protein
MSFFKKKTEFEAKTEQFRETFNQIFGSAEVFLDGVKDWIKAENTYAASMEKVRERFGKINNRFQ